jgi:hypothetical protein
MNDSHRTTGSQQNTVTGGDIINAGNFDASPVTTTIGDNNRTVVSVSQPDPLIERLRHELDEARRLLEQGYATGISPRNDAALDGIDDMLAVIDNPKLSHDAGKIRRRLDRLILALTPFAGIIQGIASSVDIFKDIRSAI